MQTSNMNIVISCVFATLFILRHAHARGRPAAPANNPGEYGPETLPPKPYAFNYEIMDKLGNVHFRKEELDPSGVITGSYGYMKVDGLFRTVEYIASAAGYKAKVKTNEPGTKGPGSADVDLQADPVPQSIIEMFEKRVEASGIPVNPIPKPIYTGMKG